MRCSLQRAHYAEVCGSDFPSSTRPHSRLPPRPFPESSHLALNTRLSIQFTLIRRLRAYRFVNNRHSDTLRVPTYILIYDASAVSTSATASSILTTTTNT